MGTRYWVTVTCQECKAEETVWYAPTCGVKMFECDCGNEIDLEAATGITEEDASNYLAIKRLIDAIRVPSEYFS